MATLITDPALEERLIEERRASGGDKFDEVWDGVYVMAPLANNEHQGLAAGLTFALHAAVALPGLGVVFAGVNVSDREDDWQQNYRCPDVAVYLRGTAALDLGTHWQGGPDLAVEVVSKGDRSRQKLDFYAAVDTRELLVIDRSPWSLELYRLADGALSLVGANRPGDPEPPQSAVLQLSFRLRPGDPRPILEVARRDGAEAWPI